MPTDLSRSEYPAFLVPDSAFLASTLASDSSYTAIGPIPGVPAPADSYQMALTAHGSQAASGDLTIQVQAGGVVGRNGASFVWKNTSASAFYGWDAPTVLTGWVPLVWATSPTPGMPHAVALPSGTIYAV